MDRRGEWSGEDRAGLVSLGLLMQLIGSVVAAYLIVQALEPVVNRVFVGTWYPWPIMERYDGYGRLEASPAWHVTLLVGIGALRALLHRRAGSAVLYRSGGGTAAVARYVAAALAHTVLCLLVFTIDQDSVSLQWTAIACVSLGWPLALLLAIRRPGLRRILDDRPAAMRASAPEQVGTLMIFLGLVGALVSLFALYSAMDGFGGWSHLSSVITAIVAALLCVRSVFHAPVGFRIASRDPGSREPLASSYVKVGLVTAALAWGSILVLLYGLVRAPATPYVRYEHLQLVPSAMSAYLLVVWPLLLRRLSRVRTDARDVAVTTSSRSSAALPALGWLLLAAGTVQIGFALISLGVGESRIASLWIAVVGYPVGSLETSRGPWFQLLLSAPQIWVAVELLRSSSRRRRAATLFAVCGSGATVLSIQADMHYLARVIGGELAGATVLVAYLQITFSLLVPVATLVFVQHHLRREISAAPAVSIRGGE